MEEGDRFYSQLEEGEQKNREDEYQHQEEEDQEEEEEDHHQRDLSVLQQYRLAVRELRQDSSALDVLFELKGAYGYNFVEPTTNSRSKGIQSNPI